MAAAVAVAAQWVVANWAAVAAVAAAGYSAYKAASVKAPTTGQEKRDYKTTLKQATAPVRRVYGCSAGGGILTFVEEQETTAEAQKMIVNVVTAGHEINKLKTIWFGDKVAYSDHLETSPELIKMSGKGRGVYTRFKGRTANTITIDDYNVWEKNLRYGLTNKIFMGKVGEKWVALPITNALGLWTAGNRYGGYMGCKLTSSEPLPENLTAIKIGDSVYKFEEGNNPRTPNQVPKLLRDTTQWKTDMYGYNLHYVAFELTYDRGVFPNGIPQFKFEREGAKLYDPRKDSSVGGSGQHIFGAPETYEYSNNAALVILDFFSTVYGYTKNDLDLSAFIEAANHCDEIVQGEKRFTINGEFDYDEAFLDVLGSMLQSCAGSITQSAGKIGLKVGVYQGIADAIVTDKDITSDISINAETSYQDKINTYEILYSDPNQIYEDVDCPSITSQKLIDEDGKVLATSLDLSKWVTSSKQAQRIGWINLRKSRDYTAIQLSTNLSKIGAIAGKKLEFNLDAFNIAGEFKSQEWEFDNESGITLTLIKDDISYYKEDFTYHEPARGLIASKVKIIPTVTNLTFSDPTDSNSQGVIKWNEESDYSYRVTIYKDDVLISTTDVNDSIYQINGLLADDYKVRVSCINSIGQEGQETSLGFTALPPPIQSFTWIAYADDQHGHGISLNPENKTYVGVSANHTTETPDITDPSVFTWALFKGSDGTSIKIKGSANADVILAKIGEVGDTWISLTTGTMPDGRPIKVGDGLVWTTANKWDNIGAIRGQAGKDGLSYRPFFKVSATVPTRPTGTSLPPSDWSDTPPHTNQGQTTYIVYTYVSNIDSSVGNGIWSAPAVFSVHAKDGVNGVNGNDGVDGNSVYTEFWFSVDGVGNPTSNPNSWSNHQRSNDHYVITRTITNNVASTWAQATKFTGTNGTNGTNGKNGVNGINGISFETRFKVSRTQPSMSTADRNNPTPSGWSLSPIAVTYPVRIWAITATKHATGALDTIWSTPVLWNGDKGDKGNTGATGAKGDKGDRGATGATGTAGRNGSDGTTWAYKNDWNGVSPTNSTLDTWFRSLIGRTRKDNDVFVIKQITNGKVIKVSSYLHKGSWIPYTQYFDGNVMIDGTLTGKQISSKTTITAGSGSHTAGMNGDDVGGNSNNRNWRIWAGNDTASTAPFRVAKDGTLYASKGVFSGEVKADKVTGVTGQAVKFIETGSSAPDWYIKPTSQRSKITRVGRLVLKNEKFDRRAIITVEFMGARLGGIRSGSTQWDSTIQRMCDSYTISHAPSNAFYDDRYLVFKAKQTGTTGTGYNINRGSGRIYARYVGTHVDTTSHPANNITLIDLYGKITFDVQVFNTGSGVDVSIPLEIELFLPKGDKNGVYWGGYTPDSHSQLKMEVNNTLIDANVFIEKNASDIRISAG